MGAKRYIVGLDPGTEKVGFALMEDDLDTRGDLRLLDHELIAVEGTRPFRLYWIHERLTKLFSKLRDRRLDVAVEKMFISNNPATAIILGEARGVVLAAAGAVPKARLFDYFPSEHKKTVAGHGGATKYQAMLAVRLILKIDVDLPLDVADACCIGVHHARIGH